MNIQDAIKTGKAFGRKNWYNSCRVAEDNNIKYAIGILEGKTVALDADDILAEDWEVKE